MKNVKRLFGASILVLASLSNVPTAIAAQNQMAPAMRAAALPEVPASALKLPVAGTLSDGRPFAGTLSITKLALSKDNQLLVSGVLEGIVGNSEGIAVGQVLDGIPASLKAPPSIACDILNLDLEALNLDLLGLVVDLAPVRLDVTAEPGPGNLLGNLLCAVVGLLDNPLGSILKLIECIDKINDILAGK